MSAETETPTDESMSYIPVVLLPNAQDLLKAFGDSIERIDADGSRMTQDTKNEYREYGISMNREFSRTVSLHYRRNRDTSGEVTNPLTDSVIREITNKIHERLAAVNPNCGGENITYDIPVSRLVVEVQDYYLQQMYGGPNDESFYFDFRPIDAEEFSTDFKKLIEPLFQERNLSQQGFEWEVLVLHQIIPNQQFGFDYEVELHEPVFSWEPRNRDTTPLSVGTAQEIAGMLPNEFTTIQDIRNMTRYTRI